jgi:hypothetical protein
MSLSSALPILAGFLAASAMAWLQFSLLGVPGGVPVILLSALYVLLIAGANALGVYCAGIVLKQNVDGVALRSSIAVAWIAPFAVYFLDGSPFAIPMAAMVVVCAVPLFPSFRRESLPVQSFNRDGMLRLLLAPPKGPLLSLVCAAGCLQACIAASVAGATGAAIASAGTASGIIAWQVFQRMDREFNFNLSRQIMSSILTLTLAFLLTTGGIGGGYGIGDGNADDGDDSAESAAGGGGGDYWGVFLWTGANPAPHPLVAPAGRFAGLRLDQETKRPLKIRFDGVYWFFKWPDLKPPSRSTVMHGSPTETAFRSMDTTPVVMEAHQPLRSPMDPAYFNQIEVAVRDADRYPGTVEMELILSDSAQPFPGTLSLGRVNLSAVSANVHSVERLKTVSFTFPDYPSIRVFNEVTIRFHLNRSRDTRSPRIAVEDLVLIPR